MRYKLTREHFIPKGSTKISDKLSDAIAYIYTTQRNGKPGAMVFYGKQAKPVSHVYYKDETRRAQHIAELFANRRAYVSRVAERRTEDKAFAHSVQVGDIFSTCWGYDQTNVEFFEVTKLIGAKMCELREIACASDNSGGPQERIVPQSGLYLTQRYDGDDSGLPIRRLIQKGYNNQPHIKISDCRSASPWGKRVAGVVVGAPASRTGAGWGH